MTPAWRRTVVVTTAAIALIAASLIAAVGWARQRPPTAETAINGAIRAVVKRHPRCAGRDAPDTTFTAMAPSDTLLATLGVLRAPASAQDAYPLERLRHLGPIDIYSGYVRRAATIDGVAYFVVTARDSAAYLRAVLPPAYCYTAFDRALVRRLRRAAPSVRSRILRAGRRFWARQKAAATRPPAEGIYVAEHHLDGREGDSFGGGVSIAFLRSHGLVASDGTGAGPHAHARVHILLPDGVASIRADYAAGRSADRAAREFRYTRPVAVTAAVTNNLTVFDVPRAAIDAVPWRMLWRDAAGNLIRTVTKPRSRA